MNLRVPQNPGNFLTIVLCFLLGDSPASEFYKSTFRNTETECSETSAYKIQTPGELPKRKHTTFRTRRKFEI